MVSLCQQVEQRLEAFLFAPSTMALPSGNHATHARRCWGVPRRQMRAGNGGCNAGPGSSKLGAWNSGASIDALSTHAWGVGGVSPSTRAEI